MAKAIKDGSADSTLPFEQARDELQAIVTELEVGGLGLEESLRRWQRGEELVRICQVWLDQAQASIARVIADSDEDKQASANVSANKANTANTVNTDD